MTATVPIRKAAPDVLTITDPDQLEQLAQLFNGFGHELRLRIIQVMRDGKERSPSQIANILAPTSLGVVAYHFRQLRQYGVVTEVRTQPRRGALEHFYVLEQAAIELEKRLRRPLVRE